jgi:hypothetical protein
MIIVRNSGQEHFLNESCCLAICSTTFIPAQYQIETLHEMSLPSSLFGTWHDASRLPLTTYPASSQGKKVLDSITVCTPQLL